MIDFTKPVDKSNRKYPFWYLLKKETEDMNWWIFIFLILLPIGL